MRSFSVGNFKISLNLDKTPQGKTWGKEVVDVDIMYSQPCVDRNGCDLINLELTWEDVFDLQHALKKALGVRER